MKLRQVLVTLFSLSSAFVWAHEKLPTTQQQIDTIPLKERYGDFLTSKRSTFDLKDPSFVEKKVEYDPATNQYIITEKIGDDYFRAPTYMSASEYFAWKSAELEKQHFNKLAGVGQTGRSKAKIVNPFAKIDVAQLLTDRLFGGTEVSIVPQGNIDLTLGLRYNYQRNPVTPVAQQRQIQPDFNMDIQVNVTGKVGEKLSLTTNYNNKATFAFDNLLKLNYDTQGLKDGLPGVGDLKNAAGGAIPGLSATDDQILKDIDAGNVSLPLKGNLIQGASSLFGLKTELQFGKLRFTTVLAQQQSRRQQLQVQQGGQKYTFQISGDQYDENRHFFFSHSNRNNFEKALTNLPQINSLFQITYLEVWVTNDRNETNNVRDIVALTDLGEPEVIVNPLIKPKFPELDINGKPLPTNDANNLYDKLIADESMRNIDRAVRELTNRTGSFQMQQTKDFEKVRARKLNSSDYTFDPKLGYISVNFQLRPNQVLGVAYTYKYNGKEYKVGELSANAPQIGVGGTPQIDPKTGLPVVDTNINQKVLFVKMLKSSTPRLDIPLWDLMMKNVYSLGASQINREDFRLEIYYNKPGDGERRFLPDTRIANVPLLRVFNLDRLNVQGDPQADGVFDFVEGVTINSRQGKVIFPVLEPFGKALAKQINDPNLARKYVFQQLYDTTITAAREFSEYNVFTIKGQYKGTSQSEIQLNSFNLPRNSVKVFAGSQQLVEGVDFEVNLSSGTVKILNEAYINSAVPVNVTFEDTQLFGFQQKSMVGARWDYTINKDFVIGGTLMKLFEKPFTNKVNIGEDPINNNIIGLDVNYTKEAPWITRLVDRLPMISTKAPSSVSLVAEGAFLKPGHSRAIDASKADRGGVVYIDDFEGSTNGTDLRQPNLWFLASVPQNDRENNYPRFPESSLVNDARSNSNRAKLMWYRISDNGGNSFSSRGTVRNEDDNKNPDFAPIQENEIWPSRGFNQNLGSINANLFEMTYLPSERGPYNYETQEKTPFSSGIDLGTGRLNDPKTRWAGIMRALPYNDFEASNVEFIDMWVLSPFLNNPNMKGKLHIDIGNVSEDILRDSRQFYENGLPTPQQRVPTDRTTLARIPRIVPVTNTFDNSAGTREIQDVGLDGLNDEGEKVQFKDFLDKIQASTLNQAAKTKILTDPSNDNFRFFLDPQFDNDPSKPGVFERYKNFNNPESNSRESDGNQVNASTNIPDSEDLDNNKSLDNEGESYFHYEIPLEGDGSGDMLENRFVVDNIPLAGKDVAWGTSTVPKFFRIRVPLNQFTKRIGGIQDFRSIRFIRMYLTDFDQQVTLRFAKLELSRSQWRRYRRSPFVGEPDLDPGTSPISDGTTFDVNSMNFEENNTRPKYRYVIPPGIQRETLPGNAQAIPQNEQSMGINLCNLQPEAERGIYKLMNLDMRLFQRLKMFVHAEPSPSCSITPAAIKAGELSAFIRIGNDFERNYYEYEIPLRMSDEDALNKLGPLTQEYAREIWPENNEFNFSLDVLRNAKEQRNALPNPDFSVPFQIQDPSAPNNRVTVKGNPNLGWVRGVMIGVRNKSDNNLSPEVWFNELRVNGLDEQGGAAGLVRLDIKLADLGRTTVSGNYTGIGWGGLEQRMQQRSREKITNFDVATNLELSKFLPEKARIKIPMTFQYSDNKKTPEYDPYDLDIKLNKKLATSAPDKRDSLREQALTINTVRNLSFDNVRKERSPNKKGAPMPWEISNFTISYQNTQDRYSDPIIENEVKELNRGQLDYSYEFPRGAELTPLKKVIKKDKYLKFLSDFNFRLLPNNLSFNTNLERRNNTTRYRFTPDIEELSTYYNKRFAWDRKYNLNWDLSKGIKFNFGADVQSVIDEPTGRIDTRAERDTIWQNIRGLGRTKVYAQTADLNYILPTNQIPFMDWVKVRAKVNTTYNWNAAALNTQFLGNTIKNSQQRQVTGDFDFEKLYNNSKYLSKINRPKGTKPKKKKTEGAATNIKANRAKDGIEMARNRNGRDIQNANTVDGSEDRRSQPSREEDDKLKQDEQQKTEATKSETNKNEVGLDPKAAAEAAKAADKSIKEAEKAARAAAKKAEKENREPSNLERALIRPLLMVRKGKLSYTETFANTVPGFKPQASLFGQQGLNSPGWDFLAGRVPTDNWLDNASRKEWIVREVQLNESVIRNYQQQIQANLTVEPFTDFRIEFEANKNYSKNHTQDFKTFEPGGEFDHRAMRDVGSYTVSYMNFKGLLSDSVGLWNLYNNFSNYRKVISQRLAGPNAPKHDKDAGYYGGYGRTSQDVLIPSFMAAFTGQDANNVNLNVFNTQPLPNWRLNYNGLQKLKPFKDKLQSFTLTHSYRSSLQLNQYNTNSPDYDPNNASRKDQVTRSYYTQLNIPTVSLTKEFSPLIGIDIKLKNDLSLKADFKKAYNVQLSFFDNQLMEQKRSEYTIGFGYRMKNVHLKFLDFLNFTQPSTSKKDDDKKKSIIKLKSQEEEKPEIDPKTGKPKKKKKVKKGNDLDIKCDFALQDNVTFNNQLDADTRVPTRGEYMLRISPSIDYKVNKQLTLRFYMDYNHNTPKTSLSYPTTTARGGVQLRFSLQ